MNNEYKASLLHAKWIYAAATKPRIPEPLNYATPSSLSHGNENGFVSDRLSKFRNSESEKETIFPSGHIQRYPTVFGNA